MTTSLRPRCPLAVFVILILWLGATTCAYEFSGGSGTSDDPYQIADVNDLAAIGSLPALLKKHYVLVADLDLDPNLPGMPTFDETVITVDTIAGDVFQGVLDGCNHTIRNLHVSLFAITSGEVRNLRIENADIGGLTRVFGQSEPRVGILANWNWGRIHNCQVTGVVSVNAYSGGSIQSPGAVGGLIGVNDGVVTDCHASVAVTGQEKVGGLVGHNTGRIIDSRADGPVAGHTRCYYVGGLVGYNGPGRMSAYLPGPGIVLRCQASGDVTAPTAVRSVGGLVGDNVRTVTLSHASGSVQAGDSSAQSSAMIPTGGLVGYNAGEVSYCYATGSVSGGQELGGLVGCNDNNVFDGDGELTTGFIRDCYSTGQVVSWCIRQASEPFHVGALVGKNSGSLRHAYYLDHGQERPDNGLGTALTVDQMDNRESFAEWDFYGTAEDGSADHWFAPIESPPVLSWQTEATGLAPVPDVAGMTENEAGDSLRDAGFLADEMHATDYDRFIPEGNVLFARPHTYAPIGSAVGLVVSRGRYDWALNPGAGTESEPYQIATAGQLEAIGEHPGLWSGHFALTSDIDMAPRCYPTALIAPGLSQDAIPFSGHFDGRGYTVSNLAVVASDVHWKILKIGMFGGLSREAAICDLTLKHARITPDRSHTPGWVGLLAGSTAGTIVDCHVSGEIFSPLNSMDVVGGLVGESLDGRLSRCSATVSINARQCLGGLVGLNTGVIEACYAKASVCGYDIIGALTGQNSGVIEDCHAAGSVSTRGNSYVGALVGVQRSAVRGGGGRSRNRSLTSVTSVESIANCYTTATIERPSDQTSIDGEPLPMPAACLAGYCDPDEVMHSYFLITEGQETANDAGQPLTLQQMQKRDSYVDWDFYGSEEDGIEDVWFMPDGETPVLAWQTQVSGLQVVPNLTGLPLERARQEIESLGLAFGAVIDHDYASVPEGSVVLAIAQGGASCVPLGSVIDIILSLGPYNWQDMNVGDGSTAAPYEIETPGQLESLAGHPELYGEHFAVVSDIDLLGRRYEEAVIPSLSGDFDGRGHTIRNLTIQTHLNADPLGLFATLDETALVTDLRLMDVRIAGEVGLGALAGQNHGTVTRCCSTGILQGLSSVGGLIGENLGYAVDCYTTGSVRGRSAVGGLIGANGFAPRRGPGDPGTVRNCYTLASVSAWQTGGSEPQGILVGNPACGDIMSSYYLLSQDSEANDEEFGQGLTESQMQTRHSFVDWDFENVWTICEGRDSPRLRWENRSCPGS